MFLYFDYSVTSMGRFHFNIVMVWAPNTAKTPKKAKVRARQGRPSEVLDAPVRLTHGSS